MSRVTPTILIIDDDQFFLEFYKAELSQYDYHIEFARDGQQGIDQAKKLNPDLILLDVILPKKDGFEVLAEIKQDPNLKNTPVIIVSTLGTQSDIDKLMQLGAIKTFNKITYLPKDVADYVTTIIGKDIKASPPPSKKPEPIITTKLNQDQINQIFKSSLVSLEGSLQKLFNQQPSLEDMQASLIPFSALKSHLNELSKLAGTLFIYSSIKSNPEGLAILSIKRNDTLNLIELIQTGTAGKNLGLEMSDQVIEEFFNIIINAFLTKLADSTKGSLLLQTPTIINSKDMLTKVNHLNLPDDQLVVFFNQAYLLKKLDLSFSIFITFSESLFKS